MEISQNKTAVSHPLTHCHGSIFFEESAEILGISSNSSRFCFKKSLCSGHWKCGIQMDRVKVQVLTSVEHMHLQLSSEVINFVRDAENIDNHSREKRDVELANKNAKFLGIEQNPAQAFVDQTKRMFYFLANLNPESVQSPVRILSLLEKTVEIVTSICDPNFLNQVFMREVLRGFLFLLKEQGSDGMTDIGEEDFMHLTQALDACAMNPAPLTLMGFNCPPEVKVKAVSRLVNDEPQTVAYSPSESSFQWGKYDVFVDAIWYAISIVHGACFATFRQNINFHHKYEVSMEELFKGDILTRWRQPLNLVRNYEYDHILLAPVNQSMHVLDACTVGAYLSSPFRHRLQRPFTSSRKRRATKMVRGHCLGNTVNLHQALKTWKERFC